MYMTQVLSVHQLSPHMKRIVLTSDDLSSFPENRESAHIKVIFPNPNSKDLKPRLGFYFGFKKWMRSYTVRAFNKRTSALTIDFAVNDHQGLASNWANTAKIGDYLGIAGPSERKHTNLNAHKHLFLGDFTALPAIAATLEQLPSTATGHAFIQVPHKQDIQQIVVPNGLKVSWLVTTNKLTDQFHQALIQVGNNLNGTAIFIAGEASLVKQLKTHLKKNCDYNKANLYASAYWNQRRRNHTPSR